MGYRTNARIWNGNDKLRLTRKTDCEMPTELTCGPRGNNRSSSTSSEPDQVGMAVQKDKYNLAEFQTDFDNARFYVIKSYSEDDVHKCLKYDVWSSTANGNKKLDAAFHDAEVKATETGIKCPIFLFFSVSIQVNPLVFAYNCKREIQLEVVFLCFCSFHCLSIILLLASDII